MAHTGSCLCGAAKFSLSNPVTEAAICHCDMCRKWSGGMITSVEVPAGGLAIVSGDTVKTYQSSDWGERAFCGACGSGLWFHMIGLGPLHGIHYVNMGALDDPDGIALVLEMFIDAKPDGYALAGDHQRMTRDEFHAMIEASGSPDA